MRPFFALLLALAAAGPARAARRGDEQPPKLIVLLVLDQYRYDFVTRFREHWDGNGAWARLSRGAVFTAANYGHATTYTGPGHAHLVTGAYAYQNGMVGNRWYDRASGKVVPIVGDPEAHWLGSAGDETNGTSPRNLVGTTLGDELLLATRGRSKVVAVALKARSAILLGGKLGKAYWFNETSGQFVTSSYYTPSLPDFVSRWNQKKLADTWFGGQWPAVLPQSAALQYLADDAPWEGDLLGMGRVFPHPLHGGLSAPGEAYYDALTKSPFANDLQLDFVKAAVEAEELGRDQSPDLLAVSLSATDEVGHTYGPSSREVLEMAVATDRQIGAFLKWLDTKAPGALIVLTSDHGASPAPEEMAKLGIAARRIKKKQLADAVEAALDARYGAAEWVLGLEDPSLYLNLEVMAQKKLAAEAVENAAAAALREVPGVSTIFTRTALLRGDVAGTAVGRAYQVCFYPPRSGDLFIVPEPYSFWGKYAEVDYGGNHGSPYTYDTHVPLVLYGPWILPGIYGEAVSMADLAPTLAAVLRINPPPAAEGRPLARALR